VFEVVKTFTLSYGHTLPYHNGKCKYAHGHNARIEVTLRSNELHTSGANLGMVEDFGDISTVFREQIISNLDHKFLSARGKEPHVRALIEWNLSSDVVELDIDGTTAEELSRYVFKKIKVALPYVCKVTWWETDTSYASYSEGL